MSKLYTLYSKAAFFGDQKIKPANVSPSRCQAGKISYIQTSQILKFWGDDGGREREIEEGRVERR